MGNAATAGTHVDITSTEAICIKTTAASASWIVQSKTITVRGTADTDLGTAVELNSRVVGGTITFMTFASSFGSLNATPASGISISKPISTTTGQLSIEGDYDTVGGGITSIQANSTLTSKGDLRLHPRSTGQIIVVAPADWTAVGNVYLSTGVWASGTGATLSIIGDSDASGSNGALIFSSTANISVVAPVLTAVYMKTIDLQWSAGFALTAGSSNVYIDSSYSGAMSFGGSTLIHRLSLQ